MTAAWKQKKFERLAQKDLVEKLKGEVAYLQDRLAEQKESRKYYEERMKIVYQQRDEAMILANRYNMLRSQELMIATSEGFKLVTGEELDIHCGATPISQKVPVTGWPTQHVMTYSLSEYWSEKQSEKFSEQLAKSMVRTRETMKEGIEIYGLNTGSTGQEEDKKNP